MYSCPRRANSSNLPVAAPPKRQPISRSLAIPTLDVTMYKRRGGVGKETKLQVNIGVHSNSNKAGRQSGGNTVGSSGAMSASAGNCGGRGPTRCQGDPPCCHTHSPNGTFQSGWFHRYPLSGTSQDRTVSSRAPLGGEIEEQQT